MKTSPCLFQPGDKVQVKKGVIDPDFNTPMDSWSGEIKRCFLAEDSVWVCSIIFDQATVSTMGKKFIDKCDRLNLNHTEMNLEESALQPLLLHQATEMKTKKQSVSFFSTHSSTNNKAMMN